MARQLTGTIVSKAGDKTVVVQTTRSVLHPLYRKRYQVTKKFATHDPENKGEIGQTVTITETRPISARKRFTLGTPESKAPTPLPQDVNSGDKRPSDKAAGAKGKPEVKS